MYSNYFVINIYTGFMVSHVKPVCVYLSSFFILLQFCNGSAVFCFHFFDNISSLKANFFVSRPLKMLEKFAHLFFFSSKISCCNIP